MTNLLTPLRRMKLTELAFASVTNRYFIAIDKPIRRGGKSV
jgi:hypothetical protein